MYLNDQQNKPSGLIYNILTPGKVGRIRKSKLGSREMKSGWDYMSWLQVVEAQICRYILDLR